MWKTTIQKDAQLLDRYDGTENGGKFPKKIVKRKYSGKRNDDFGQKE